MTGIGQDAQEFVERLVVTNRHNIGARDHNILNPQAAKAEDIEQHGAFLFGQMT